MSLHTSLVNVKPKLMKLLLNEAGIPGKYHTMRLEEFVPVTAQEEAYDACVDFVTNLHDHYVSPFRPVDEYPEDRSRIGKGLFFNGHPGRGKTALAAVTIQEVFLRYRLPVLFIAAADLIAKRFEVMTVQKQAERGDQSAVEKYWVLEDAIQRAYDMPVVGIDDFGKEHKGSTGFVQSEIDKILRYRHRNMKPTILTTNKTIDQVEEIYDSTMTSFMDEAFDMYAIGGRDRRAKRRSQ